MKYEEYKTSIIAVQEVRKEKINKYGVIQGKKIEKDMFLVEDLIEKPSPESAPSNLAISGRYVLTPAIFNALEKDSLGIGNEIQLTHALRILGEKKYADVYRGRRYRIGNKIDWIKSYSELFLQDERLSVELTHLLYSLR